MCGLMPVCRLICSFKQRSVENDAVHVRHLYGFRSGSVFTAVISVGGKSSSKLPDEPISAFAVKQAIWCCSNAFLLRKI